MTKAEKMEKITKMANVEVKKWAKKQGMLVMCDGYDNGQGEFKDYNTKTTYNWTFEPFVIKISNGAEIDMSHKQNEIMAIIQG